MAYAAVTEVPPLLPGFSEMARQHQAVRLEVVELRGMIDSCRATQRTDGYRAMLAVLVCRLRERLTTHFELEEEHVLVGRLGAGDPAAADALAGFARQHAALLDEGARLGELLRAATPPPKVVAKTMQWLDDLRAHEQAEDDFLAARADDGPGAGPASGPASGH